jgi:rubredoxin
MTAMTIDATLTCPVCGFAKQETMLIDACQVRYRCTRCGVMRHPMQGDCCVYCSGSVPCPPIQQERAVNEQN